jgi:hypothetical protein
VWRVGGELVMAYKILVVKFHDTPFVRVFSMCNDRGLCWRKRLWSCGRIQLAKDRVQLRDFVNTVLNCWVP